MRLRNRQTKKDLRKELKETKRELAETKRTLHKVHMVKNQAYRQRNTLVSVLSKLYPAYLAEDPEQTERWKWVVFVNLPTGQVSWHLDGKHDLEMFQHLEIKDNLWDGHTTPTKYERLMNITV